MCVRGPGFDSRDFSSPDLIELVPCSLYHSLYIKLAINSGSWLYYGSLVLGRKRQYSSLNTITCEPRPFSVRF